MFLFTRELQLTLLSLNVHYKAFAKDRNPLQKALNKRIGIVRVFLWLSFKRKGFLRKMGGTYQDKGVPILLYGLFRGSYPVLKGEL